VACVAAVGVEKEGRDQQRAEPEDLMLDDLKAK
jgi:hypothetical protein